MQTTNNLIAIDLAKNVFEVHGFNGLGKRLFAKQLKREELLVFMAQQPQSIVATESCGGSHYWARQFNKQGHTPKLIAPQFVKPFRKTSQKNDGNDAGAIAEAAQRPSMRYVPIKSLSSQDLQSLHRVRQGLIATRTSLVNQCRGLAMEYGVVMDKSVAKFKKQLPEILEEESELTSVMRDLLRTQFELFKKINDQLDHVEELLLAEAKKNENYERLLKVPGIGPMCASQFLGAVGDVSVFKNGRHLAAWAGLVPRQLSSGGQVKLLGITKAGDPHLRSMLVHGARALILWTKRKQSPDPYSKWILDLLAKKGWNVTAVAIANKNCRIMYRLLKHQENYKRAV